MKYKFLKKLQFVGLMTAGLFLSGCASSLSVETVEQPVNSDRPTVEANPTVIPTEVIVEPTDTIVPAPAR